MNMLFVLSLMVAMLALVAVFIEMPFVSATSRSGR